MTATVAGVLGRQTAWGTVVRLATPYRVLTMGKGDADTRSPNHEARYETMERVRQNAKEKPPWCSRVDYIPSDATQIWIQDHKGKQRFGPAAEMLKQEKEGRFKIVNWRNR